MVRYEVRQQVSTVRKSWLEVVFECPYQRPARHEYERLTQAHPNAYFELVEVVVNENCLAFRPQP